MKVKKKVFQTKMNFKRNIFFDRNLYFSEESSQETYSQPLRSTSAPTTVSTTTTKLPKQIPTISSTEDKLNKDYNKPNSYSQSHPSLVTPIVSFN